MQSSRRTKMNNKVILEFLTMLQEDNSLEWMQENKKLYQEAKEKFEGLIQETIVRISAFDDSIAWLKAKDLVFRLNRDTRFSKDKSPYNPSFRSHISSAGRLPIPAGYFICVKPGESILGGGVFATQFPDATTLVRDYLTGHGVEFLDIINNQDFRENFQVFGEKLKNVPRGYDKNHRLAEFLKHKSWALEYALSDAQFADVDGFLDLSVDIFRKMKPFNDYLNRALASFTMPQRP